MKQSRASGSKQAACRSHVDAPVATVEEAVAAARALGFPVVVKGVGAAHKSEAGLVVLGVGDDAAVQASPPLICSVGRASVSC